MILELVLVEYVFNPWTKFEKTVQLCEELEYRVKSYEFSPLGANIVKEFRFNQKHRGNAYYTQIHEFFAFDVAIANVLDKILTQIINPDL